MGGASLEGWCWLWPRSNRTLAAGFLCVLVLRRKWRELSGFMVGACPLVVVSWAIAGGQGMFRYPGFLLQRESGPGVDPLQMANLRGLLNLLCGPSAHLAVVSPLSVAVLVFAASAWQGFERGFCTAILATILVSYHLNPQDLSLMLIPLLVVAKACTPVAARSVAITTIAVPVVLSTLSYGSFVLLSIAVLGMLIWMRYSTFWLTLPAAVGGSGSDELRQPGGGGWT